MLFSGLRTFCNCYRSFIFPASKQVKFISRTNIQFKANFLGINAFGGINPYLHQFKLNATFLRPYCSESITITFKLPDGTVLKRSGTVNDTIRSIIGDDDPSFQGYGCCGGSMSCMGCHVIFSEEDYDKLEPPDETEEDLLDKVNGLTLTSRLGCAICLVPEMDGTILEIPKWTEAKKKEEQ